MSCPDSPAPKCCEPPKKEECPPPAPKCTLPPTATFTCPADNCPQPKKEICPPKEPPCTSLGSAPSGPSACSDKKDKC